jgi:hypothetical protein
VKHIVKHTTAEKLASGKRHGRAVAGNGPHSVTGLLVRPVRGLLVDLTDFRTFPDHNHPRRTG